jgi:urease accessory protein UreE
MTVVEKTWPITSVASAFPSYAHDTLTLTWEERRRGHGKRQSDGGIEFAISLPNGTLLRNGDCFILDAELTIVKVREAYEPVFIVRPETPQRWAFYAYHVGNRHQAVMIGDVELILLQNPAVRSLLEQLDVPYTADSRSFTGSLVHSGHSH